MMKYTLLGLELDSFSYSVLYLLEKSSSNKRYLFLSKNKYIASGRNIKNAPIGIDMNELR